VSLTIDLRDKIAIVTGGGGGIGRAVAGTLARAGAQVLVLGRTEATLAEACQEIRAGGGLCDPHVVDVADPAAVSAAFEAILEAHGRIDILVNNAGITRDNLVLRMKEEEWSSVVAVNLGGVFHCTQAAARAMLKARGGKIINLASVSGFRGNPGQSNYTAAKGGILAFTKSCAKEFASRGVQVNAVAPGLIETEMTTRMPGDARQWLLDNVPLGRLGTPAEVADAVLFLASPWSDYVTGHVLVVDGGLAM